jgi:hypothetical protein
MMVASYSVAGEVFTAEKPRLWSPGRFTPHQGPAQARSIDLHLDGERLAVAGARDVGRRAAQDHIALIFNFFDELRRIAPPARR